MSNLSPGTDWLAQLKPHQRARIEAIMERASWNMARGDAISICYRLQREIKRDGGPRQRSEGTQWLRRIRERLLPWVQ